MNKEKKIVNRYGETGDFCCDCCNYEKCDRPKHKNYPSETIACDDFDLPGMEKIY